jgi:formylglycine-generating enzyme required for sulfatase activity
MVGNVAEWVADRYRKDYYRTGPERNPPGPSVGDDRVVRGGSFDDNGKDATPLMRRDQSPDERSQKIGFRCARDGD